MTVTSQHFQSVSEEDLDKVLNDQQIYTETIGFAFDSGLACVAWRFKQFENLSMPTKEAKLQRQAAKLVGAQGRDNQTTKLRRLTQAAPSLTTNKRYSSPLIFSDFCFNLIT